MGTARMKQDNETDEEGKKRGVSMETSKAGTKERSPDCLNYPNQNTTIINIMLVFYNMWKKYNSINKK